MLSKQDIQCPRAWGVPPPLQITYEEEQDGAHSSNQINKLANVGELSWKSVSQSANTTIDLPVICSGWEGLSSENGFTSLPADLISHAWLHAPLANLPPLSHATQIWSHFRASG